jgi:hypothetical protein
MRWSAALTVIACPLVALLPGSATPADNPPPPKVLTPARPQMQQAPRLPLPSQQNRIATVRTRRHALLERFPMVVVEKDPSQYAIRIVPPPPGERYTIRVIPPEGVERQRVPLDRNILELPTAPPEVEILPKQ